MFFVPLKNFSIIWRRKLCLWRASNFDLFYPFMTIEQWGLFSLLHLLWHGTSVYNGHLRGPVTRTPIALRLAVELSLSVFLWLRSVAAGIRTPNLPVAEKCSNLQRHRRCYSYFEFPAFWHPVLLFTDVTGICLPYSSKRILLRQTCVSIETHSLQGREI